MYVTKDTCNQANSENNNPTGGMFVSMKKEERHFHPNRYQQDIQNQTGCYTTNHRTRRQEKSKITHSFMLMLTNGTFKSPPLKPPYNIVNKMK
jgi:hypothetical protein